MIPDTGPGISPMLGLMIGWFDPLVLAILAGGFWLGRRNGAVQEHFPAVQWFCVALVGGIMSRALGKLMAKWLGLSLYATGVFGYIVGGGVILIIAAVLRTYRADEMLEARFFERIEPAAGGVFGALKFGFILLIPLAILHAHHVPVPDNARGLRDNLHVQIFQRSLAGAVLEKAGAAFLIPKAGDGRRPTVGQKKNQQMDKAGK